MAFFKCIARLNQAAGRTLTDAEVNDIFERINAAAIRIKAGKAPPPGRAGMQGVIDAVAQEAAAQKVADAERKADNAAKQIVILGQRMSDIKDMKAGKLNELDATGRLIANRADGKANQFSLENRYIGISSDMKRGIQDTWLALGNDFLGFIQNTEKVALLLREMRGENTGDAMAKKGAKAWLDMAENARLRFNDGGGQIGKIEDWALPQHHSSERVARAGKQAWVDAVMPAIDRSRYADDAGVPFNDVQMRDFLANAWDTIAQQGNNKIEPGKSQGIGAKANRHAEERQVHFKDANAYLNYWAHFGEKTVPDILMGHVETMARDIALVEHFGPNPELAYATLRDTAVKQMSAEGAASPDAKVRENSQAKIQRQRVKLDTLWDVASGKVQPVADQRIANVFETIRNLNVAGKLGSAFWASFFGDKVMMETVAQLNNLPMMQRWYDEVRLLNPANAAERRQLQRQGLMLEYMNSAMGRWGDEYGKNSLSGKLASGTMRLSGMNAINEWRRGSFGLGMMSALGREVSNKNFANVDPHDMHVMQTYGINEADWKLWKLATLEDLGHGNDKGLTPESLARIPTADLQAALPNRFGGALGVSAAEAEAIAGVIRREAVTKLLGVVNSESRFAIVEPGWRERAQLMSKNPRGTWSGEISRAFWQFKSFPIAQFERMWDLAMSRETVAGKAGTLGAIMVMQATAGAMLLQTRELLAGKDPRPVDWKFGISSFLQGGALGIYGDFLYGINQTRVGSGPLEAFAGPTIGTAIDFLTSTLNAGKAEVEGKETHLMAKYLQLGKGFIPGSNLWYAKAAFDHIIFQNAQEMLSPGYLSQMESRTQREYGQGWWWRPGDTAPSRTPSAEGILR